MALTKDDIAKALSKETGYLRNQSVDMVETLLELIKFSSRIRRGRSYQRVREVLRQDKTGKKRPKSGYR